MNPTLNNPTNLPLSLTRGQLCDLYEISRTTLWRRLREMGLNRKGRRLTRVDLKYIIERM